MPRGTQKDQPIGALVAAQPALAPERRRFVGRYVALAPLTPHHADGLYEAIGQPERAALWTYMFDGPYENRAQFVAAIAAKAQSSDPLFYCLIDPATEQPQGYAALMRIDLAHRVIEIGNIMFSPKIQRTRAATEALYLLARYVFEECHFRRYEWKCNDLNQPSKRAALRLGFSYEGLFCHHMIVKGRNRDTAWFAMIERDWKTAKQAMETWLQPDNFDADGRQKISLAALTGVGLT